VPKRAASGSSDVAGGAGGDYPSFPTPVT
jgi:hypothetical protein